MKEPEKPDTAEETDEASGPFEVLDVFGLKLKVSNPRLAELLTMEAKEALTTDIKQLIDRPLAKPTSVQIESKVAEIPTLSGITSLEDYHRAIHAIGNRLGFEVDASGIWRSPTGIDLIVRPVKDDIDVEKARLYAVEMAELEGESVKDTAGLFVVGSQLNVDTFKVAIRTENLYHVLRVISYDNLKEILLFKESGKLSHAQVVTLMVPLDEIDLGELMNVLKAVAASKGEIDF